MSGETEKEVSGWTTDTLREFLLAKINDHYRLLSERLADQDRFLNARVDAQADKVVLALTAADRAVNKAETATEKRFEGVNEFRQTLSDQATTLLSRNEYNAAHTSLVEKVQALSARLDKAEGKGAGVGAAWGWALGAAGLIIPALAVLAYMATK